MENEVYKRGFVSGAVLLAIALFIAFLVMGISHAIGYNDALIAVRDKGVDRVFFESRISY